MALFMLASGAQDVVKAQITGSIIGNALLGLGLAALIGGWGREKQMFGAEQSGRLSSLLILSLIALMLPVLFDYTERDIFTAPNPGALDDLHLRHQRLYVDLSEAARWLNEEESQEFFLYHEYPSLLPPWPVAWFEFKVAK